MTLHAESNEDLLKIIERLEARIEQLEAKAAVEVHRSESASTLSSEPLTEASTERSTEAFTASLAEPAEQKSTVYLTDTPPVPPLELIPARKADAQLGEGVWHLYLNIEAEDSSSNREVLSWHDVSQHFDVVDSNGVERQLAVNIVMSGEGQRTKTGRSVFFQDQFYYDFKFVIRYELSLDDGRSITGEKYLTSSVLGIDQTGKIPNRLLYAEENLSQARFESLPVQVQFGCNESTYKIANNLEVTERAMTDINRYACLRLSFFG